MKISIKTALCALLCLSLLCGCGRSNNTDFDPDEEIGVFSREDGSGTRSAFVHLFGIEQQGSNGIVHDRTVRSAVITNSTAVMLTAIAGDRYAIGYVSFSSLCSGVKAVSIDGAAATIENVKNGTYSIVRPLCITSRSKLSPQAADFIDFIMSERGQSVIEDNGYAAISEGSDYTGGNVAGKIIISGSSSVAPVMEKLKEVYCLNNPNVTIELQQSDSSTGILNTIDGTCDIGMSSRELKNTEIESGITERVIAIDAIAVIVSCQNSLEGLTSRQVRDIFTGEIRLWGELPDNI